MEETKDTTAPAAEQGAAQPEATGTPPAKSAAETKLESQLAALQTKSEGYKKERDAARKDLAAASKDLAAVSKERDTLRDENAQLKRGKAEAAEANTTQDPAEQATTEAQQPSEEEVIKDLLRRNGLKVAYMLPSGPCFSEDHAREYAGPEFDSLTTITLD
jgi:myosin heavy subunit